jgi:hypothetical protein
LMSPKLLGLVLWTSLGSFFVDPFLAN